MQMRRSETDSYGNHPLTSFGWSVYIAICVSALLLVVVAFMITIPAYNRYQARANANNKVKVSAIEIRNQEQRIKVTKQQAQIRFQKSVGIRKAQDEIARTLTPLYVKFEMVDALRQIATSGSNNSVIYIPTDKNGMVAVPTANTGTGK